jgi:putative MFS transporter
MASDPTPVGEVLDRIPIGPYHRRLLGVTGAAWALAAVEVLLISFTLPVMTETWGLSGAEAGVLGSASLLGMVFGSALSGRFADRNGRVGALRAMVAVYALSAGITALSVGFYTAVACRVATGVGIGGTATVATTYLSEHLPTKGRGRYLTYLDSFWAGGTIVSVVAAWIFLAGARDALQAATGVPGWRLLFLAAAAPLLLLPFVGSLRETPYYLVATGQTEAARERIRGIARLNGGTVDISGVDLTISRDGSGGLGALLRAGVRGRTAMISVAWFGANFGLYGVFIWLPGTLGAAGLVGGPYRYILLAGIVQVPGYLTAASLVDRIGSKRTLGIYLLCAGGATYVFAVAVTGTVETVLGTFWSFLVGLLGASFFSVGSFGALRAYTPELFSTEVRSTGLGVAEGSGRVAGILGPIVAGSLVESGYVVALTPLAVGFALSGLVVLAFGTETRGLSLR